MQGQLVALDLQEGSPLLPLVHTDLLPLRTTFEGDFGTPLGDVYMLQTGNTAEKQRRDMSRSRSSWELPARSTVQASVAVRNAAGPDVPWSVLCFPR